MSLEDRGPVGFFPAIFNLAETSRLVRIAERYCERGGRAVFFSHGGVYESLAAEAGFPVVRVDPIYTAEQIDDLMQYDHMQKVGDPFPEPWLEEHVRNEERAYAEAGVSLVVTGFNLPCSLSARKAGIPLVWIVPGTGLPPYFQAGLATLPDALDYPALRWLPARLKDAAWRRFMLRTTIGAGPFKRLARRYGLPGFPSTLSLWTGDYTLVSDLRQALEIPPELDYPEQDYTGPLLAHLGLPLDGELRAHLERPGPRIYFALGSSGEKRLYLRVLDALARTGYSIVAAYTTILDEGDLPPVPDNVLLRRTVPAEQVAREVDLSVLHGGQGTFYTAAYAGRPVVALPMQFEQQYNMEILARNGSCICLSRRHFREKHLRDAIDRILGDYERYRERAEALARRLPVVDGAARAADRILDIQAEVAAHAGTQIGDVTRSRS